MNNYKCISKFGSGFYHLSLTVAENVSSSIMEPSSTVMQPSTTSSTEPTTTMEPTTTEMESEANGVQTATPTSMK